MDGSPAPARRHRARRHARERGGSPGRQGKGSADTLSCGAQAALQEVQMFTRKLILATALVAAVPVVAAAEVRPGQLLSRPSLAVFSTTSPTLTTRSPRRGRYRSAHRLRRRCCERTASGDRVPHPSRAEQTAVEWQSASQGVPVGRDPEYLLAGAAGVPDYATAPEAEATVDLTRDQERTRHGRRRDEAHRGRVDTAASWTCHVSDPRAGYEMRAWAGGAPAPCIQHV
jgi:hypothetical protein